MLIVVTLIIVSRRTGRVTITTWVLADIPEDDLLINM